jgi:hypothetical protein
MELDNLRRFARDYGAVKACSMRRVHWESHEMIPSELFLNATLIFHDLEVVGDGENSRYTVGLNICNVLVALIVNHTL